MKRLVLWAFLSPLAALSQVQKCQIDGKTVYSDSLCGQTGVAVNVNPNSMDTSALRKQAASAEKAAEKERAASTKRQSTPGPCDHIKWAGASPTQREAETMRQCMRKFAKEYRRP
jgi:hypothetical protein